MGEIIMRNWHLREFRGRVIWPFLIRHLLLPIWRVRTPIQSLPNPMLVSHIRSPPLYCSHLHSHSRFLVLNSTIIGEHKVKSSLSISPWDDHELTPSKAFTESTAFTHDCVSSLHSQDYELTPECRFRFRCAYLQDHHPALHESSNVKIPCPHSHGRELPHCRVSATGAPPFDCLPSAASKYTANLTQSWPPSASPNSLDLGLQVTLSSHNTGLQVYFRVYLIVICRRTSNCSQPPPAACPYIPCVDRYIDTLMRIQTEYMRF